MTDRSAAANYQQAGIMNRRDNSNFVRHCSVSNDRRFLRVCPGSVRHVFLSAIFNLGGAQFN